jgi:hypothetical protein
MFSESAWGSACSACHPVLPKERMDQERRRHAVEEVRTAALELMSVHRDKIEKAAEAYERDDIGKPLSSDARSKKVEEAIKAARALERLEDLDERLKTDEKGLADVERSTRQYYKPFDWRWLDDIQTYTEQHQDSSGWVKKTFQDLLQRLSRRPPIDEAREWVRESAEAYQLWRERQRIEVAANIGALYEKHPFFANLPPEALVRIADPKSGVIVPPENHIRMAYTTLLAAVDDAVERIKSDDIDPLSLPQAVKVASLRMDDESREFLSAEIHERDVNETLRNMTIAAVLPLLPVLGEGIAMAAGGGAILASDATIASGALVGEWAAAAAGGVLFLHETEQFSRRLAMEAASGTHDRSLLGVPALSGGDAIMFAIDAILTALGLVMVSKGTGEFLAAKSGHPAPTVPQREVPPPEKSPISKPPKVDKPAPASVGEKSPGLLKEMKQVKDPLLTTDSGQGARPVAKAPLPDSATSKVQHPAFEPHRSASATKTPKMKASGVAVGPEEVPPAYIAEASKKGKTPPSTPSAAQEMRLELPSKAGERPPPTSEPGVPPPESREFAKASGKKTAPKKKPVKEELPDPREFDEEPPLKPAEKLIPGAKRIGQPLPEKPGEQVKDVLQGPSESLEDLGPPVRGEKRVREVRERDSPLEETQEAKKTAAKETAKDTKKTTKKVKKKKWETTVTTEQQLYSLAGYAMEPVVVKTFAKNQPKSVQVYRTARPRGRPAEFPLPDSYLAEIPPMPSEIQRLFRGEGPDAVAISSEPGGNLIVFDATAKFGEHIAQTRAKAQHIANNLKRLRPEWRNHKVFYQEGYWESETGEPELTEPIRVRPSLGE